MILKRAGLKPPRAFTELVCPPTQARKPTAEAGAGETPHQRARDRRTT